MFRQKQKNLSRVIFLTGIAVIVVGCRSKDRSGGSKFEPGNVFLDYRINAREADDNLTVLLQFREGGEKGDAISIAEWGKVTLDGEVLPGDSTKRTGFFYEVHKPIGSFSGKHTIILSGDNNEEYKEDFDFRKIVLLTPISDTLTREELVLEFEGLESKDYLRLLVVDTSATNDGINRVDTLQNGRLIITKADLEDLHNGPIQLLLVREFKKATKNGTNLGGWVLVTYSLSREFFLRD